MLSKGFLWILEKHSELLMHVMICSKGADTKRKFAIKNVFAGTVKQRGYITSSNFVVNIPDA